MVNDGELIGEPYSYVTFYQPLSPALFFSFYFFVCCKIDFRNQYKTINLPDPELHIFIYSPLGCCHKIPMR